MHRFQCWKSPDLRSRLFAVSLLILAAQVAWSPSARAQVVRTQELSEVLSRLERDFVVHTLTDGYALQTTGGKGTLLIEVRAGAVAIEGEPVGDEALRAHVGRDNAKSLRALSVLTADRGDLRAARKIAADGKTTSRSEAKAESDAREQQQARERGRRRTGDRFRLFRGLRVERNETASEAVAVLGNVTVLGEVRDDAVAVGGSVRVEGSVRGDVTAVGGSVVLGPRARIGGGVTSVGGEVRRSPGAQVRGSISEISAGRPFQWFEGDWFEGDWFEDDWRDSSGSNGGWNRRGIRWPSWPRHTGPSVGERSINAGLLTLLTLVFLLVVPGKADRLARRVQATPLRAAAVGVAVQVATLPLLALASLVLLVSVIGIPLLLLLPVALFALLVASLLGYASAAAAFGRWLVQRLGRVDDGPLVIAVVGVVAIQGLSILGEVFDGLFGPFGLLGLLLLTLGFGVRYLAWTVGLGAVVLATFGRKLDGGFQPPPPRPPLPIERERGGDPLSGWRA